LRYWRGIQMLFEPLPLCPSRKQPLSESCPGKDFCLVVVVVVVVVGYFPEFCPKNRRVLLAVTRCDAGGFS